MSKAQNILICLTALIIGLSGIAVFTAHAAVFIVSAGFIVFSLTYAFFLSREVLQSWLAKNAELKYLLYAIGAAVAAIGILGLVSVFGYYLYSFSTIKTGGGTSDGWLKNADYLSAAATIIGAFIALIPIILILRQIKLQRKQNNADMFIRACELTEKGLKDYEPNECPESLILLRGAIPLLREVVVQDKDYSWVAVKVLLEIYTILKNKRSQHEDRGLTLRPNVLEAIKVIVKHIEPQDYKYYNSTIREIRVFLKRMMRDRKLKLSGRRAERYLRRMEEKFGLK